MENRLLPIAGATAKLVHALVLRFLHIEPEVRINDKICYGACLQEKRSVRGDRMDQIRFYRAIKQHCIQEKADCTKCCLRLYCYTPPCERTDSMMEKVISFLAIPHSDMEADSHSDHYTCAHQPPCPCSLDMSSALGYEPH